MELVKRTVIAFWLKHIFLRRLGKRYPDVFKQMVADITDSALCRKIIAKRYIGDDDGNQMGCEAIAIDLRVSVRRVFQLHKDFIDKFINA